MEAIELMQILSRGEDSRNQFKRNINNDDSLAREMVAFCNSGGGKILIGVDDDGSVSGLTSDDIRRLNNMISNVASEKVKPPVNPLTEIISISTKNVLLIDVPMGLNKPYQDKDGVIWVKNGADKRKATSREELQRLFQSSGMIHADVTPVNGMTIADIDMPYFSDFFRRKYGESLDAQTIPLSQTISNLNLGQNDTLNLTGALLFSKSPSVKLPSFIVKAAVFPGDSLVSEKYIDSRDITGKLADIYQQTLSYMLANIKHVQGEQSINSVGQFEIPRIVFEELLVNALVHRDYFISAPVRVFIFPNRIEIINPGHLPNNLSVENIKAGNSNIRNPVLASFAYEHILPYRGFGSGILRALEKYRNIEFVDDRINNQFKCTIIRA
jgi:ATP-dependent DNA helicase RecG